MYILLILNIFTEMLSLLCHINKSTCYQSKNPSCISLTFNNKQNSFKLSDKFKIGLPEQRQFITTIMKSGSFKGPPNNKSIDHTKNLILITSTKSKFHSMKNNDTFSVFEKTVLKISNK